MKELENFVSIVRRPALKKVKKPRIWKERDFLNGNIENSFVLILRTIGCSWAHKSGCLMCGYFKETYNAGDKELVNQINEAYRQYNGEKIVKIFTSGSFLDTHEIPKKLQLTILKKFSKAKKIIIESRPEYIKNLDNFDNDPRIEVAMGLESANDLVLEYAINKGFTFDKWHSAATQVKEHGMSLRVYILIKPPFLTEKDAIKDAIKSAEKVKKIADVISFNPVAIHSKTIIEYLWRKKLFSPPWLWSVVDVLRNTSSFYNGMIKCDVVAGGKTRGSHNCGRCDQTVIKAIRDFSLNQSVNVFENISCACQQEWMDLLEIEPFIKG